jgi:hypothetical protein
MEMKGKKRTAFIIVLILATFGILLSSFLPFLMYR